MKVRLLELVEGSESESRLRVVIILMSIAIGLRIALSPYRDLAMLPDGLYDPPFWLAPLPGFPSAMVLIGLQCVGVLAVIATVLNRWPRLAFAISWSMLLVLGGISASRGKILHPNVMTLYVSVPLLFAPGNLNWKATRCSKRFGMPIRAGIATLAVVYFFTGVQKIVTGGVPWVTSDNMRNVFHHAALDPMSIAPSIAAWTARYPLLCNAIALATLVIECGALAIIPWRRTRIAYAVLATGMHFSIWLLFGLNYSMWAAAAWILLVDWGALIERRGLGVSAG